MRILGLAGCCALAACVNLTPPWEKVRDAGRSDRAGDSAPPSPGADAGTDDTAASADLPAPPADADEGTPAVDAPILEDGPIPVDADLPDGPITRDTASEGTGPGDVRSDGKMTDGREAGADAGADAGAEARQGFEDARTPDAPISADSADSADRADTEIAVDSAPEVPDTNSSVVTGDAAVSPDAALVSVVKLTGTAFGTGPAYSSHPTATFDKAFDGDPTIYFDDSNAGGGYAGIDVGGSAVVSFIRYYPREGFIERMVGGTFQCSASSQTDGYVDLFTITATPPSAWTTVPIINAPACRYFRYLGGSTGHTNLGEIEFWATDESGSGSGTTIASLGASLTNLALGRPASASSEQTSAGKIVANGNDGLAATVFCPADGNFPAWYEVDLGDVYPLQQTDILVENAPATYQYQIDVSLDGAEWTATVAHLSDATGGRTTLTDDFQAQARYLRVTYTGATSGNWGCVRELMVWSTTAPPPDAGI
jgi:hypothetical protein